MSATATSTVALVHGNPETAAIWGPLIESLERNGIAREHIVTLSPPGFGCPLPDGFEPTSDAYLVWLADAIRTLRAERGGGVDVVGHDWGAGHVFRLAGRHPDLLRSWAADIGGLLHPDYRWHDAAQAWMTPDVGEQVIATMLSMPRAERIATYQSLGLPAGIATEMADAMNADMGRAILGLYRSAPESKIAEWATELAEADRVPGLIITAVDDAYVGADLARDVANRLDCDEARLEGQGHWWMIGDPEAAAAALVAFWASHADA